MKNTEDNKAAQKSAVLSPMLQVNVWISQYPQPPHNDVNHTNHESSALGGVAIANFIWLMRSVTYHDSQANENNMKYSASYKYSFRWKHVQG